MTERIPVYLTTLARQDPIRELFAMGVLSYWVRHREVSSVTVIIPQAEEHGWKRVTQAWADVEARHPSLAAAAALKRIEFRETELDGSQRRRHIIASALARASGAEFFVQADDDILPRVEMSVAVALDLMRQAPRCAMAVLALPNCPLAGHTRSPTGAPIAGDQPAGGVRFCRTAAFAEHPWPESSLGVTCSMCHEHHGPGYDVPLWEGLQKRGWTVGVFGDSSPPTLRATNLIECSALSSVWSRGMADGFPLHER